MVVFVVGGSGSGKSEYAEQLAVSLQEPGRDRLVYVATMKVLDEESRSRVGRHRSMRAGKGFETREYPTHLESLEVGDDEIILLECLPNLLANEMFSKEGRGLQAKQAIRAGICRLAEKSRHLIIVGSQVFEDGVEYDRMTETYKKQMADLHRFLGRLADRVVEVVFGIPVEWK